MINEEIIVNNKLIAEFMDSITLDGNGNSKEDINSFKYHKSWDWLMPVVDKIENLGNCQIDISFEWCRICYKGGLFEIDTRNHIKANTKIEAVYFACIEFIKWYNDEQISK